VVDGEREDGRWDLYHLRDDRGEQRNLSGSEPVRAKELQQALAAWRKIVGARMPQSNPNFDPARANELAKGK
jgi:arylsulfatase A